MPDGFILLHTDNTLSAFTDENRSAETIQKHEDWFKR
jgi:CDP-diacylglycerol pyrophosphatase